MDLLNDPVLFRVLGFGMYIHHVLRYGMYIDRHEMWICVSLLLLARPFEPDLLLTFLED